MVGKLITNSLQETNQGVEQIKKQFLFLCEWSWDLGYLKTYHLSHLQAVMKSFCQKPYQDSLGIFSACSCVSFASHQINSLTVDPLKRDDSSA